MASLVDELISILTEEEKLYSVLLECAEEKTQILINADIPALDDVEGIGEVRARNIKQSIKRMQEQFIFDNAML